MPVDELWYHADRAKQQAEQAYHRLDEAHEADIERETQRSVSRPRFKQLAERTEHTGAPFGAHTIVHDSAGEVILVRHEEIGRWVLPGGEVDEDEPFRVAAQRELKEEAGISAAFRGLAILTRVAFSWNRHEAWGVLPIFEARANGENPTPQDPDDEISAAAWFEELPEDTRDRDLIDRWLERYAGES